MANQDLVTLLKQGANSWNSRLADATFWESLKSQPHFGRIDFSHADLRGIDLHTNSYQTFVRVVVDLDRTGATYRGSKLRRNEEWDEWEETYAVGVSLSNVNLACANLSSAKLTKADLSRADLSKAVLSGAHLNKAHLIRTQLQAADLRGADLSEADLTHANFTGADLREAKLKRANLSGASLSFARLGETNFSHANLHRANLYSAELISTNFKHANLTECLIYGVSTWGVQLEGANQENLVIARYSPQVHLSEYNKVVEEILHIGPAVTVDNLEVAQFIYLLLNNQKIRSVIDTITSKVVLILGRFTPERKAVLYAIRAELRHRNYLPVIFDFEKPTNRDLTETVSTLAHLARFIIVDLTDPSSAPHEMASVVPHCVVPVQPLLLEGEERREYSMFKDLRRRYHWVLPTYHYQNTNQLLSAIKEQIIAPAEQKVKELEQRK